MPHVFISYVREDKAAVDRIAATLKSNGVGVWLDRQNIKPGERWDIVIMQAVREGDFFIACFSDNSVSKKRSVMHQEIAIAVDELIRRPLNRVWFIPVLLSQCEIPNYPLGGVATLNSLQHIQMYTNWGRGIEQILGVVAPNKKKVIFDEEEIRTAVQRGSDLDPTCSDEHIVNKIVAYGNRCVPVIISTLKNPPPSIYYPSDFDILFDSLGKIGEEAADAIPAIIDYLREKPYYHSPVAALGDIGNAKAVPFLSAFFEQNRNTTKGAFILNSLAKIGQLSSIPLLIEAFLDWNGERNDIVSNSTGEGHHISELFPYRELDALRYFGTASMAEFKKYLTSQNWTRRARASCALAVLDEAHSQEYEDVMVGGLNEGGVIAQEALFGLRCFKQIQSAICVEAVVAASCSHDTATRLLALKVLLYNCEPGMLIRGRPVRDWFNENKNFEGIDTFRFWPTKAIIWDEIYYVWEA